ncbi:MAG: acetone carboxylase subunit gamma [Tepidiphilus sp.]|nr:acetone carboxylase subunit gamma [Tepidiphilus sp.]MDK2798332.1 acetone carboxylase, gamma subunit [Tepidiphilus sp.]
MATTYTKEQIEKLIDGRLDWDTTFRMLAMPKDPERFELYVGVLQERLGWKDKIILPLGPHLYIVQTAADKRWVIKCDCGHEFCDYRQNWKMHAVIYVRDTEEALTEIYPKLMAPDPAWQVYREYYCPECGTLHDVEAPTPWYPVIHDFEPDIEAFYKEWLGLPVPERAAA